MAKLLKNLIYLSEKCSAYRGKFSSSSAMLPISLWEALKILMANTRIPTLFFVFVLTACANSGEQGEHGESNRTLPTGQHDSADARLQNAGSIEFNLAQTAFADSLQAYIVGKVENRRAQRSSEASNRFQINNLPAGRYDIILSAVDPQSLDDAKPLVYGLRINGVLVSEDRPAKLGDISLEPSQDLVGTVYSTKGPLAGAQVEFPGTDFVTITDRHGNYRIQGAPKGQHRLLISKDGFHSGRIEQLRLDAGSTEVRKPIALDSLTLWNNLSASGPAILSIHSEDNPARQLSVHFVLLPPETANLMRISEQEDLENAHWQPLQTSINYTFSNPGNKKLYVQYSRDRSQLSSILAREVVIQLP